MRKDEWKFKDSRNTMVITTKRILEGKKNIVYVLHDAEDGMWQFLDGDICTTDNASIVSLEEIYQLDNSIHQLADLPLGYSAFRKTCKEDWKTEPKKS